VKHPIQAFKRAMWRLWLFVLLYGWCVWFVLTLLALAREQTSWWWKGGATGLLGCVLAMDVAKSGAVWRWWPIGFHVPTDAGQ